MVDRVYRAELPRMRRILLNLKKEFAALDTSTDWVRLRVGPLLAHLDRLQAVVRVWDSTRLRGAVPQLHADLVYFRKNVLELQRRLDSELRLRQHRR